jgi:hypothetical protein
MLILFEPDAITFHLNLREHRLVKGTLNGPDSGIAFGNGAENYGDSKRPKTKTNSSAIMLK